MRTDLIPKLLMAVLASLWCFACSGDGAASQDGAVEFEYFKWHDLPSPCGPLSDGTVRPCLIEAQVDSQGNAIAGQDNLRGTTQLQGDELLQLKIDMTDPEVVAMYRSGCPYTGTVFGDMITTSLKLTGQEEMTVDYAGCSRYAATVKIEMWVGTLLFETKPWT